MTFSIRNTADFHERCSLQCQWTRELRSFLLKKLLRTSSFLRILEVGCGSGAVYEALCEEFSGSFSYIGVDISPDELTYFSLHHPKVPILRGNGELLPFSSGSFDFVFCQYVLLWSENPQWLLREMKRVTRRGGICAAMAEPDYTQIVAAGGNLPQLIQAQRKKLCGQGARSDAGGRLLEWFADVGFNGFSVRMYDRNVLKGRALRSEAEWLAKDCGFSRSLSLPECAVLSVPTFFAYAIV